MGGKRNQAQRTKNNVKPSSSSRSADLLGKDVTKKVGFISLKQNVFASKTDALEDFESIDPNFQVALKKLSKKDAVTKQKGLQELTELCKEGGSDACKALLPYWCRLYCSLSLDVDNKVRENTQLAHRAVVSSVGRNLAPYLRQIAPLWFVSQFDTYPPAASAASATFKSTFPENKLKEVISFCHNEIFGFLYDNLIEQTAQSLSKIDMSKEDSEAKYERVIICCLNGYSHYVETLSSVTTDFGTEINDKFTEANRKLLSSNKYWTFASHKAPIVRAAWYAVLISLCKNALQFVKEEAKHVMKTVFSNLDESDPLTLPLVWESALYSLQIINECCEQVSLEKVIFPKLCSILEKGGLGNAVTIYPNLLPFLSNISTSLTSDKYKFYQSFFHSLHTGLKQRTVKLSHSESEVIINTYMECFRYVIMLYQEDSDFCLHMMDQQLFELLKETMMEACEKGRIGCLYLCIADMISYWQRNISTFPCYKTLLDRFWQEFSTLCLDSLTLSTFDPQNQAAHVLFCHYKFLETFIKPQLPRSKKNLKVKFDDDDTCPEEPVPSEETASTTEPNLDETIKHNLYSLGGELMKVYYRYTMGEVSDEFKNSCISQLSVVVKLLGFDYFTESCQLDPSEFCMKLHTWLKDDIVPVEPNLLLTFTALGSIEDEQLKKSLLQDLIQVRPEILIKEAVKLCVTGKGEYQEINSWLKTDEVRAVVMSFLDSINTDKDSMSSLQVVKLCLTSYRSKEYIIGDETVAQLLNKLSNKIESADSSEVQQIIFLLEDTFKEDTQLFFKSHHPSVFALVKSILSKCFTSPEGALLRILNKGISCCLCNLDIEGDEIKTFIKNCGLLICNNFEMSGNKNVQGDLVNVVNVSHHLVSSLTSRYEDSERNLKALNLAKDLLTTVLTFTKTTLEEPVEEICVLAHRVEGDLPFEDYVENCFSLIEGSWSPLAQINISSYSQSTLFCVKIIFSLLGERVEDKAATQQHEEPPEALLTNSDLNQLDSFILDFAYRLTLLRSVSKHYSSAEEYFHCLELIEELAPCLKELVQRLDEQSYPNLFSLLSQRVCLPKTLWAQTEIILKSEFLELEISKGEYTNERILTEGLEEGSLRSLRNKLKSKTKGLDSFINYVCWKFDTYNKLEATSAYDTSLNSIGLLEFCLSSEIARFLTELIKYDDSIIEKKTWDFIMNSIAAWVQSMDKTSNPKYCREYVGFVVAVCNLFVTFSAYLGSDLPQDNQTQAKEERNKYIRTSWNIFASDVHSSIFNCWKGFAEKCGKFKMEPVSVLVIETLSNAVCHIVQGGKLSVSQNYELISLTKACSHLILSPCPAVQITSFLTLDSFASQLAKLDSGLDENSADRISILHLKDTLLKTQTVVEAMLIDMKLGVMCLVSPYTDSYTYTRAYLMTWMVLLDIFKAADSKVRHLYTCWMKEEGVLNHMMDCLLHLLPNIVVFTSDSSAKKIQEIFSAIPSYSYSGWTSGKLSRLSGFVYIHVLRVLPLLSRLWYSESEPKKRDFIDKFTAPYVSPLLIYEEINFALNETKKCETLSLEALPTARLVNAIFTVEDSKAELGIQLAHNHPFTPPKVDISKSVVSSNQTKQKLKQLTLFPTLQNGSLWDCIIVWKNYLDKKFEGVEECYICYSVLHYGTLQLPKLTCRTCKKRFHSACLYKWFTSSNKSTCPMCRNLFF